MFWVSVNEDPPLQTIGIVSLSLMQKPLQSVVTIKRRKALDTTAGYKNHMFASPSGPLLA